MIRVKINKLYYVNVLVDSGSNGSHIDRDYARQIGARFCPLKNTDVRNLLTANKTTMPVSGKTVIEVMLNDKPILHEFTIVKRLIY